jgi:hypothetical protein
MGALTSSRGYWPGDSTHAGTGGSIAAIVVSLSVVRLRGECGRVTSVTSGRTEPRNDFPGGNYGW